MANGFRPGDYVVYKKTKFSRRPGPRAVNVRPASNGDSYSYTVDKYWVVQRVAEDGTIVLHTPGGKVHHVNADDPLLRRANVWERWRHRDRFESSATARMTDSVTKNSSQGSTASSQ
jgi:hypothetical protein